MSGGYCGRCGGPIEWARTETGRRITLDAARDPRGNLVENRADVDGTPIVRVVEPGAGNRRAHDAICPARARHPSRRIP